ncbi:MAG TPA: hypothetical protein VH333_15565 [Pseudonocardiaceae bacterium]|nr:hypothetical protein [Pseudonocardiaceae bacterium]
MTWRSGLGLVDLVALSAIAVSGALPGLGYQKSDTLVDAVDAATGLGPGPSYDRILDLARPWVAPLSLVDFRGNVGSLDQPAAPSRYTEARLSPFGALALAAENGEIGPVPIGLINGNTDRRGSRPPFDPRRVITALLHVAANPGTSDDTLVGMVGSPRFPTGCEIDGDLDDLFSGRFCPVTLRARARRTASNPVELAVDCFPPGVSVLDAIEALTAAGNEPAWARAYPRLADEVRFPLRDVADTSSRHHQQITCRGTAEATVEDLMRLLRMLWPLGTNMLLRLPAPLPILLRQWVAAADEEDITASLRQLEKTLSA